MLEIKRTSGKDITLEDGQLGVTNKDSNYPELCIGLNNQRKSILDAAKLRTVYVPKDDVGTGAIITTPKTILFSAEIDYYARLIICMSYKGNKYQFHQYQQFFVNWTSNQMLYYVYNNQIESVIFNFLQNETNPYPYGMSLQSIPKTFNIFRVWYSII